MGVNYVPVLWNKQKKKYDRIVLFSILSYLIVFVGVTTLFNPETTPETLILRAFGSLAIVLLHIILAIGPLSRINTKFLPLLYNRRHLGVSMFLIALIHGGFAIIQFHTLGDINPLLSLFSSNMDYHSLTNFPFQILGFLGLLILAVMASTSHDFWLANLGPKVWKTLHMGVYFAYALILLHVFLGAFQQETSPVLLIALILGFISIFALHVYTGIKETRFDKRTQKGESQDWQYVCELNDIEENRAKMTSCDGERIAIFKYEGKLSAVHNVCKHQNGPLGEGKIVDGCITCPWHGYQYLPSNGQSPPPFHEKVATYRLKLDGKSIYVDPKALDEGTHVEPINLTH